MLIVGIFGTKETFRRKKLRGSTRRRILQYWIYVLDVYEHVQGFYNEIAAEDISEVSANQEYLEYLRSLLPKKKAARQLAYWFHRALCKMEFILFVSVSKRLTSIVVWIHVYPAPFSNVPFEMSPVNTKFCFIKEFWCWCWKEVISKMVSNEFDKMTTVIINATLWNIVVWCWNEICCINCI